MSLCTLRSILGALALAPPASARTRRRARTTGMEIGFMAPAELDATVKTDLQYGSKVIRDANIRAD